MYVSIYPCLCVCIGVRVNMYVCTYACEYMCVYLCTHHMGVRLHGSTCAYAYVCVYICCAYLCICIYIWCVHVCMSMQYSMHERHYASTFNQARQPRNFAYRQKTQTTTERRGTTGILSGLSRSNNQNDKIDICYFHSWFEVALFLQKTITKHFCVLEWCFQATLFNPAFDISIRINHAAFDTIAFLVIQ